MLSGSTILVVGWLGGWLITDYKASLSPAELGCCWNWAELGNNAFYLYGFNLRSSGNENSSPSLVKSSESESEDDVSHISEIYCLFLFDFCKRKL